MPGSKHKKSVEEILRSTDLKVTIPRLAVLSVLATSSKPLRIKDLEKRLREQCEEIDTVTIYRTIETLKKKGMVKRVRFDEDAAYFELHDPKEDIHHFTCHACGERMRVNRCVFPKYRAMLLRDYPEFADIDGHDIEFYGTCAVCAKKNPVGKKKPALKTKAKGR